MEQRQRSWVNWRKYLLAIADPFILDPMFSLSGLGRPAEWSRSLGVDGLVRAQTTYKWNKPSFNDCLRLLGATGTSLPGKMPQIFRCRPRSAQAGITLAGAYAARPIDFVLSH
ncbi:hypothetical protein [Celeribacter baekdonensis]|uniref:hypothetical protein n=1 Tax=Celeribacter baekdonensis TaxID=875171 RepID=UPI00131F01D2|nr:hypothetical protein [Celeribacter baekdonensis]